MTSTANLSTFSLLADLSDTQLSASCSARADQPAGGVFWTSFTGKKVVAAGEKPPHRKAVSILRDAAMSGTNTPLTKA